MKVYSGLFALQNNKKINLFSKKSLAGLDFGVIIVNCVIMAEISHPLDEKDTFQCYIIQIQTVVCI